MLVGVLISIMIAIVVGVNLIPSIVQAINTAQSTPNAPTGMSGLLSVLVYVYIAVGILKNRMAASHREVTETTGQIRGKLNLFTGMPISSQAACI